jgi:amino acid transporter
MQAITLRAMTATLDTSHEDAKLRKTLGYWSLLATGLGSVIGSGWLFAAMYAAQSAGPASLIAWVVGGLLMLAVALVFAELGIAHPESGGLVRYPLYSNGGFAAGIVGWCMWVCYLGNPPTEAAGVLQYASSYLPGVYEGKQLTGLGILLAIVLMAVFVVVNYFGVQLFAKTNNIVTAIKVLIPTSTIVLLVASGFDGSNVSQHGGFAPYGYGAALGAIASAGITFAYTGFRNIIELSGEVRNPRKHIPVALVSTLLATMVLYLGLQTAFLGAVPSQLLAGGWQGVNFDSPFAQLALLLGMSWLYWTLIADSMLSPSGAAIAWTAANARNVYGLAKNRFFPEWLLKVNERWGVPTRALIINFVVGILFLLPLPSWHDIIPVTSTLVSFTFSIGSITLLAFRKTGVTGPANRLPGMAVIAPIAFVVSALVIYWVGWSDLAKTIPIVVVGLIWYAVIFVRQNHGVVELRGGSWMVVHLAFLYVMSALGSFKGMDLIPAPWDSVIVAVVSVGVYFWGVSSAMDYLRVRPFRRPNQAVEAAG